MTEEQLIEKMSTEKRALCIVNTRAEAQNIYEALKGDGVYHLSTSMYPKHRKRILKEIFEIMKNRENKCILIATSLVEAGVDLDFDAVYRQIAGVDSMIQAAGRCNREGKRNVSESKVYVFDIYNQKSTQEQNLPISVAEGLLEEFEDIQTLECVKEYFERLYHFRGGSLDKKDILGKFKDKHFNFATVGTEFRLIENKQITLFIPIEQEAEELLNDIGNKGGSKERMRKANQYCVQIGASVCDKMYAANMVRPFHPDMEDFYVLAELDIYSESKGVDLSVDFGIGVFL